jgi:serine/threonine protein kinase
LVDQSQLDSILNSLMDDVSGGTLPGDSGDEILSTKSSSSAADLNYLDLLNEMISSTDTDITSSTLGVDDENLDSLTSSLTAEFGLLTSSSSSTLSAGTTSTLSPSPSMDGKSSEAKIDYLDMLYELIEEDKGSEPLSSPPSSLSSSSSLSRATTLSSLDSDSSLFDLIGEIMETPQSSASAPLDFDALAASITAELDVEEEQKRKHEEESIKKTEEEKKKKQEEKEKKKQEQAQKEEERKRLEQEEWERKRGELENWRKQEEERWRKEAEERSRQEEERRKREEEEWRKQREEEEKRRREEIERWKTEEERRRVEELERWKKEEEEKRDELRKAEALKQVAEEEKRKAEEIRRAIENERRIVQEEEERLRQIRLEEERKLREELDKFEEERKRRAEEERLRQIELSEQARKALEEKQRQLEDELRLQAESRAKEEELRKQREVEERRKQEEEWAKKREEYEQMVKRLDEEKRKREEEGRSAPSPASAPITLAPVSIPRPDPTSAPTQVEASTPETDEVRDLLNSLISSKCKYSLLKSSSFILLTFLFFLLSAASDDTGINFQDLTFGERLGVGTFGAMSKGSWKGAEVSIKQLAIRNITPALIDNLLIETPALKSVHHPNLVDFFGICVNKGSAYAVWDHVVGVSLHAFLRKSKIINFPFVIKTALGVANALQCLHNKDITHKTLNPKNILLDKKATIRINDYGLESVKTELGKAISLTCPEYSAPELLLQRKFNHQVDIYSFGVVLWELCTLQQPYAGLNPKQVILGVVQKGLRPPVPQNVPVVLGRLIQGCWSTDPNKRPTIGNIIKLLSQPHNLLLKQASGTIANQVAPTPVPLPRAVSVPTPSPVATAPTAKPVSTSAVKAAAPSPSVKPTVALAPAPTPTPTLTPTPTPAPTPVVAKQPVSNATSVVGRVLEYLKQPNPAAHVKALKALGNLVRTEENREALIEADSFGLIVQKLLAPEPDLQEEAARVLGVLADDGECTDLIREADGLKPLIGLLSSPNQTISFEALKTLTKMAENGITLFTFFLYQQFRTDYNESQS